MNTPIAWMIRAVLLAATCAVIYPSTTSAKGNWMVLAWGNNSCGTWLSARRGSVIGPQANMRDIGRAAAMEGWVAGYLTRENAPPNENIIKGTDFEGTLTWIDNYCTAHPLDTLHGATVSLVLELYLRQNE